VQLAALGANVWLVGRNPDRLRFASEAADRAGGASLHQKLDALIHNAGAFFHDMALQMTERGFSPSARWRRMCWHHSASVCCWHTFCVVRNSRSSSRLHQAACTPSGSTPLSLRPVLSDTAARSSTQEPIGLRLCCRPNDASAPIDGLLHDRRRRGVYYLPTTRRTSTQSEQDGSAPPSWRAKRAGGSDEYSKETIVRVVSRRSRQHPSP